MSLYLVKIVCALHNSLTSAGDQSCKSWTQQKKSSFLLYLELTKWPTGGEYAGYTRGADVAAVRPPGLLSRDYNTPLPALFPQTFSSVGRSINSEVFN